MRDLIDHRELLGRRLRALHALVGQQSLHERDQPLAIGRVRQQFRQRRERRAGLIANDDVLLAPDAPPMIRWNVRQEIAVLRHQLLLHLQSREQQRLTLAREQARDPRERFRVAAFTDRGKRFLHERQTERLGDPFDHPGLALVRDVEREHVAVCLKERRLARGVADRSVIVERSADRRRSGLLELDADVVSARGRALALHHRRRGTEPREPRIQVRERPALEPQRMELTAQLRRELVRRRLDERLQEQLVRALVELRNLCDRLERLFIGALEAIETSRDFLKSPLAKLDFVFDVAAGAVALLDLHPIKAGGQCLDRFQHRHDLRVLFLRDLARHENPEVPDVLVHQPDDDLAARLDVVGRPVHVRHPVERLLRRRDVVAHRREQNDRLLDLAQVERLAGERFRFAAP